MIIIRFFCVLFLILRVLGVFSLELTSGRLKLIVNEKKGTFTLKQILEKGKSRHLLFFNDPGTTFFTVGTPLPLRLSICVPVVRKTNSNLEILWETEDIRVTESFVFVRSENSPEDDGLKISINIMNMGRKDLPVSLRYLFDTNLLEKRGIHFKTENTARIQNETEFLASGMPSYWLTPVNETLSDGSTRLSGLQGLLNSPGITIPDRIVFGNWKRLKNTNMTYRVNKKNSFTLMPYSINDSAVSYYFNAKKLSPGESRLITILLAVYDPHGFANYSSKTSINDLEKNFRIVSEYIEFIDKQLSSTKRISRNDFEELKKILENLKKQKTLYEDR